MERKSKLALSIAASAFLVAFVALLISGKFNVNGDGGVNQLKESNFEDAAVGAIPGPDIFEKIVLNGGFRINPIVNSTTTAGSANTLVARDLENTQYHIVTPGGLASAADMTYTLPASSTLRNFVNKIGAREEVCWFHSATTTSSLIIFSGGTGVDMKHASTTEVAGTPSFSVGSEDEACMTFIRQPDSSSPRGLGNITADLQIYTDS